MLANGTILRHLGGRQRHMHAGGSHNKITRREAGIDWLTMTQSHDYGLQATQWANDIMTNASTNNNLMRRSGNLQGYAGSHLGKLFVGESQAQGWIAQASSSDANELIEHFNPMRCNCSRIDVQYTVWFERPISRLFWRKLPRLVQASSMARAGKPTSYHEIVSSDGGRTFYIGSNSSDVQCKIYNKHVEQKKSDEYKYAYRYEVRYRGKYAQQAARKLEAATAGIRHLEACRSVRNRFARYNINLPQVNPDDSAVDMAITKPKSDVATKLAWLETQVRPTIAKLLKRVAIEEVLQALGIDLISQLGNTPDLLVTDGSTVRKWSY